MVWKRSKETKRKADTSVARQSRITLKKEQVKEELMVGTLKRGTTLYSLVALSKKEQGGKDEVDGVAVVGGEEM